MACCYPEECGEYTVAPMLVAPCYPIKCGEEPPMCFPCLPRCPKGLVYCCEKKQSKSQAPQHYNDLSQAPQHYNDYEDCRDHDRRDKSPPRQRRPRSPPRQSSNSDSCCSSPCKPVKTKYVIPCYRYEDGRIEQYVPTRHGRLPMSAYRRNGMQDQIHGYRGAMRYLCAGESLQGCCVHTAIEPLRKLFPKITKEVQPVKKKKDKKP